MSENQTGKMTFRQILSEARIEKGMTYAEMEERSGVSASYIHRLETGQRKSPSLSIIMALCECLELNIHDVLERMGLTLR